MTDGHLAIADSGNKKIKIFNTHTFYTTTEPEVISCSDDFKDLSEFSFVTDVCSSSNRGILVSLHNTACIFEYDANSKPIGKKDLKEDGMDIINAVFRGDNYKTYICGSNKKLSTLYIYDKEWKKTHERSFPKFKYDFRSVSVSSKGKICVTDVISKSILVFEEESIYGTISAISTTNTDIATFINRDISMPRGLCFDKRTGNLLVANKNNSSVVELDPENHYKTAQLYQLNDIDDNKIEPEGVAILPDGRLCITDTANHRVIVNHQKKNPEAESLNTKKDELD